MASCSPSEPADDCVLHMTQSWSHEQTVRLIHAYKKQAVLWDTSKTRNYPDGERKKAAWSRIQQETDKPIDICRRKIESLLACVRREKMKILKSNACPTKTPYRSKWTYLKQFRFLPILKHIRDDISMNSSNEDQEEDEPESTLQHQKLISTKQRTLKKVMSETCSNAGGILLKNTDEFDAIGMLVAAKLRKMNNHQRIFAENIINKALYKGLLFQLNVNTDSATFVERIPSNNCTISHRKDSHTKPTHRQFQLPNTILDPLANSPQKPIEIMEESEDELKQENIL